MTYVEVTREEYNEWIDKDVFRKVDLEGYRHRWVNESSGNQKQRGSLPKPYL